MIHNEWNPEIGSSEDGIMGVDITITYEYKAPDGKWHAVPVPEMNLYSFEEEPFAQRNYAMFALFAGIRGMLAPISPYLRGLPEDASLVARHNARDSEDDCLGRSWILISELKRDYTWREIEALGPGFFESIRVCDAAGIDRLVFWFS